MITGALSVIVPVLIASVRDVLDEPPGLVLGIPFGAYVESARLSIELFTANVRLVSCPAFFRCRPSCVLNAVIIQKLLKLSFNQMAFRV